MKNYIKNNKIRRYRRNRNIAERFGVILIFVGLITSVSGEYSDLPFYKIALIGFAGIALMGLGTLLVNYISRLNETRPLRSDKI